MTQETGPQPLNKAIVVPRNEGLITISEALRLIRSPIWNLGFSTPEGP